MRQVHELQTARASRPSCCAEQQVQGVHLHAHFTSKIMPRPKPPEPLKGRQIRLTDRHMMIFQELGGIDWLRKHLDKSAKMPVKYYRLELDAPSKKEIND